MTDPESVLREFERTVLDLHHTTLPLWKRNSAEAAYGILAQFDSCLTVELFAAGAIATHGPSVAVSQLLKGLDEGLSQAMRWLFPDGNYPTPKSRPDSKLLDEAGKFCMHGSTYVTVADFHKMYGRKQVSIEADAQNRRIRFCLPQSVCHSSPLFLYADQVFRRCGETKKVLTNENISSGAELSQLIEQTRFHCDSGRIVIDDVSICANEHFAKCMDVLFPDEHIFLRGDEDLIGFTVQDYRDYVSALRKWSHVAASLFIDHFTQGGLQHECIPTQVVPFNEFVSRMTCISGLNTQKIKAITERLRYDQRTACPDIFQQPLLIAGDFVAWSVRCVLNSRVLRNMLKLMSRMPALRDHTATIIGNRSKEVLRRFGGLLSTKGGCAYCLEKPVEANQEEGDVDLLAANSRFPDEVLVVECKAVLDPDEINEVESATQYMIEGQTQLAKIKRILDALGEQAKQDLFRFVDWKRNPRLFPMVLTPDCEPHHKYDHSEMPAISLASIEQRMRENQLSSPRKLWMRSVEKPWLDSLRNLHREFKPITVGDVTYELPLAIRDN